ncbi:hypothetical protein ASF40_16865 [Microbacterium sp. Leaf288]|nr:hypothetical protein ASF40_16865 [Microbacterium sp. Leaf288]
MVSGFFYPIGDKLFERLLATLITFRVEEIDPQKFLPSSRSLLIRKSVWAKVDGYPEWLDYCEDLVFDLEVRESGARFVFAPDALVSWSARSSLRAFAKQYFRYGRGDGKANLWAKRHVARYGVYGAGVVMMVTSPFGWLSTLALLAGGYLVYSGRYTRRVVRSERLPISEKVLGVAIAPLIMAVGDVAKMIGYPIGLAWRSGKRREGLAL